MTYYLNCSKTSLKQPWLIAAVCVFACQVAFPVLSAMGQVYGQSYGQTNAQTYGSPAENSGDIPIVSADQVSAQDVQYFQKSKFESSSLPLAASQSELSRKSGPGDRFVPHVQSTAVAPNFAKDIQSLPKPTQSVPLIVPAQNQLAVEQTGAGATVQLPSTSSTMPAKRTLSPISISPVISMFSKKLTDSTATSNQIDRETLDNSARLIDPRQPATGVRTAMQWGDAQSQGGTGMPNHYRLVGDTSDVVSDGNSVPLYQPPLSPQAILPEPDDFASEAIQDDLPPIVDQPFPHDGIEGFGIEDFGTDSGIEIDMSNAAQCTPVVGGTSIVDFPQTTTTNYSNNYTGDDPYGSDCLDYGYGRHNTSRNYFMVEGLYFNRDGGFLSRADSFVLDPYDYTLGGRFTFGSRTDDLNGREISYVGPFEWEETQERVSPGGGLGSTFGYGDGVTDGTTGPDRLSTFNNATYQLQSIDSSLNSIEYNRVWNGWDVMSFVLGMRYTRVEDKYALLSTNNVGQSGSFNLETRNNLIGPQIGVEMFNDTGGKLSYSLRGKIGLMANLYEGESRFNNNGFLLFNSSDDTDVSGLFEFGATAHYQLGPSFRLRGGYEVWALTGMATARDNLPTLITRNVGNNISNRDEVLFHGLSIGLELFW